MNTCASEGPHPSYLVPVVVFLLCVLGSRPAFAQTPQSPAGNSVTSPTPANQRQGVARTYFIAADEVDWDYTPKGRNLTGLPHLESGDDESGAGLKHRVYHKAIYREYTDATFETLKPRPAEWQHLGILGPLIRLEVGDSVRVVFRNNTHLVLTIHPHGLEYTKDAEGTLYSDGTQGTVKADDAINPGANYAYIWTVPESSGPGALDGSSVIWMYHSDFLGAFDLNTGLVGPILVTARGQGRPDLTPKDVDREFIVDFSIFDESSSRFSGRNIGVMPGVLRDTNPRLREQNLLYSINGYTEGNLPLLTMKKQERVRWYLLSNNNEEDVHDPHWHGQTVVSYRTRADTVYLDPMAMIVADMVPQQEGTWLFHCHVNEHLVGGMAALFQVVP
jgi:FtsP/CotA-like multicopper oxidase with cupredoxin domain